MSGPDNLQEVYADEMRDLWSANDQMVRAVQTMVEKAHDPKLRAFLEKSVSGIGQHTATLKTLIGQATDEVSPELCKGMEGLVREARKHMGEEAPEKPDLLDLVIVSQYQRMSHYGLAGFGTASAYAKALGHQDHVDKLSGIVRDIYKADEVASTVAETLERQAA